MDKMKPVSKRLYIEELEQPLPASACVATTLAIGEECIKGEGPITTLAVGEEAFKDA